MEKKLDLLTDYVKPQTDSSKRTVAEAPELQKKYYDEQEAALKEVRKVVTEELKDPDLVHKMMPVLVNNLDEEALQAMGKNYAAKTQAQLTRLAWKRRAHRHYGQKRSHTTRHVWTHAAYNQHPAKRRYTTTSWGITPATPSTQTPPSTDIYAPISSMT